MDRQMQLISTKDIGKIAAEAFLNADKDEYRNKSISLAGDRISPNEAAEIFKQTTGKEIPSTYGLVGSALKWMLKEQLGLMFDWYRSTGFGGDVDAVRRRYPLCKTLGLGWWKIVRGRSNVIEVVSRNTLRGVVSIGHQ